MQKIIIMWAMQRTKKKTALQRHTKDLDYYQSSQMTSTAMQLKEKTDELKSAPPHMHAYPLTKA